MLPRLRYHLRRMNQESTRRWLTIPLLFTFVVLLFAGFFLSSLSDREPIAEPLNVRVSRETGIRLQPLEGIGLSTNKSLSPNLLNEGSFDQLNFRKELQARSLGNSNFSLQSLNQQPEIYRSPGLPTDQSLILFEGGRISLDRLEQGRLQALGHGKVQSGKDDQILDEINLDLPGIPRWSTLTCKYSEDQQLLETMVVLNDGRVAVNVHSELSQVLEGRVPSDIEGLLYVNKRPQAWTKHGAVYEYISEEERWILVVAGVGQDIVIDDLIALDEERYFAAAAEQFYVSDQTIWRPMDAPESGEGPWEIAHRGETLYALRAGKLFANLPPWIAFDEGLSYGEASILLPAEHRWVEIYEGSSSAHLKEDPYGDVLILDPEESLWHLLRDLRQEGNDLFQPESPYNVTHDALLQGEMPGDLQHLLPMGRGRLLAGTSKGAYLLSASYPNGSSYLSDNAVTYYSLNDMDLLTVSKAGAKRIHLTSTVKLDLSEKLSLGESFHATLEKQLSPAAYEGLGGDYPWKVVSGSHSYEMQSTKSDVVFEELPSYEMVLIPDEGMSEIRQSIFLNDDINGGELMTFAFKAGTKTESGLQRLKLVLSGPFRTYVLQSDRIRTGMRNYSISFRLPEFQADREAMSLDLSLQWEGESELFLDDIVLMTREGNDEIGISAALRHEIQTMKPQRFRFSLAEDSGFSDRVNAGINSKSLRTRLNQILQTCDLMGIEPWIILPPDWTAEEHAELFQYLAANINDPLGRQRLEDGWGQAWLRRLPRVYLEISTGSEEPHDDLLHAAKVNQALDAMTQSSSYDAVKNQIVFLDGLDYAGGRMLSAADGHAKSIDLTDLKLQLGDLLNIKKDAILDFYYADTPRLSDDAEPWIASLEDNAGETEISELVAVILEWMDQGIAVNLDHSSLLPLESAANLTTLESLSKKDSDRLLLWSRFNELTHGQRLQIHLETEADILAAESLTLLAIESGNEMRFIIVADSEMDRKSLEFSLHNFAAEQMRLHRFDREGRLYEDRDSKRPETNFTLVPGDILFVAFSSEK